MRTLGLEPSLALASGYPDPVVLCSHLPTLTASDFAPCMHKRMLVPLLAMLLPLAGTQRKCSVVSTSRPAHVALPLAQVPLEPPRCDTGAGRSQGDEAAPGAGQVAGRTDVVLALHTAGVIGSCLCQLFLLHANTGILLAEGPSCGPEGAYNGHSCGPQGNVNKRKTGILRFCTNVCARYCSYQTFHAPDAKFCHMSP